MVDEIWKDVPGFPGYQASDLGRIRNKNSNKILKPRLNRHGHTRVTIKNDDGEFKDLQIHVVVAHTFGIKRGYKQVIDHINGIRDDNRLVNLRILSYSENIIIGRGHKTRRSSHKGVHWHKHTKKWRALIQVEGRTESLGYFETEEGAAQQREKYYKILYGHLGGIQG